MNKNAAEKRLPSNFEIRETMRSAAGKIRRAGLMLDIGKRDLNTSEVIAVLGDKLPLMEKRKLILLQNDVVRAFRESVDEDTGVRQIHVSAAEEALTIHFNEIKEKYLREYEEGNVTLLVQRLIQESSQDLMRTCMWMTGDAFPEDFECEQVEEEG